MPSEIKLTVTGSMSANGALSATGSDPNYIEGNLGIGTNTPSSLLHVYGATPTIEVEGSGSTSAKVDLVGSYTTWSLENQYVNGATNDMFRIYNSQLAEEALTINRSNNRIGIGGVTNPSYPLEVAGNIGLNGDNRHIYFGGGDTFVGENSNLNKLELRGGGSSSSQTVFIDNDGRLGIGDSSPSYKLDVAGSINATSDILSGGVDLADIFATSAGIVDGSGTAGKLPIWSDTDTLTDSILSANGSCAFVDGNLGIGTNNPASLLHLSSSGSAVLTIEADTDNVTESDNAYIHFKQDGGLVAGKVGLEGDAGSKFTNSLQNATYLGSDDGNPVQLYTNEVARLTIDSSGNVGIGTTTPSNKLTVEDTIGIKRSGVTAITTLQQTGTGLILNAPAGYHPFLVKYNGTEYARFTSGGNVGINTTVPTKKLEVVTNTTYDGIQLSGASIPTFGIIDSTNNAKFVAYVRDSDAAIGTETNHPLSIITNSTERICITSGGYTNIKAASDGSSRLYLNGTSGDHYLTTTSGGDFGIYNNSNSAYRMYIDSSGNVGIGTTSPSYPLEVAGKGYFNDSDNTASVIEINRSGSQNSNIKISNGDGYWAIGKASGGFFGISPDNLNTNAGSVFAIDTSGNVGIGTTSPSRKLHVNAGVDNEAVRIESTDTEVALELKDSTGTATIRSRGDFRFHGSSGEIARMEVGGNVGIGTTSPAQKLHVSGGHILLDNNQQIRFKDSGGTERTIVQLNSSNDLAIGGSYAGALKFMGGGSYTEQMRVHDNGNIGIGCTSPTQKLVVSGDGLFTSDLTIQGSLSVLGDFTCIETTVSVNISDGYHQPWILDQLYCVNQTGSNDIVNFFRMMVHLHSILKMVVMLVLMVQLILARR